MIGEDAKVDVSLTLPAMIATAEPRSQDSVIVCFKRRLSFHFYTVNINFKLKIKLILSFFFNFKLKFNFVTGDCEYEGPLINVVFVGKKKPPELS